MHPLFRAAYGLAWSAALPLLSRNRRLASGLEQRTLRRELPAPCHVWMQAASGGEAYLAREILQGLAPHLAGRRIKVLATTNTDQGLCVLNQAKAAITDLELATGFFPFDAPGIMDRAVEAAAPRLAVLLEGEMWPGFTAACRRRGIPVLLLNGRMTRRSFSRYRLLPGAAGLLSPDMVLAVSPEDAERFAALFGRDRVGTMPNIKFDRLAGSLVGSTGAPALTGMAGEAGAFCVLGSIRQEEESEVLHMIRHLLCRRPTLSIGLFPRHMERVRAWQKRLAGAGIRCDLRSSLTGPAAPGGVVLWDVFGELGQAYGLAGAAFVGGSLKPLGGQNILEPLAAGTPTVTGPHWTNFAWAGRGLVDEGLLREATDWREAAAALEAMLQSPPPRAEVRGRMLRYAEARRGGAEAARALIAERLKNA